MLCLRLSPVNFCTKNPDKPEGELTKLRASIVCEPTLALCTKDIALGEYLYSEKERTRPEEEAANLFCLMRLKL